MKIKRRISFFSIFLANILLAEWNPNVLIDKGLNSRSILADPKYLDLKRRVMDELKMSWCSQEKIDILMDLTALTKPKVCVEVGAFTGSTVLPVAVVLKYLNSGKIFAIDAWSNDEAIKNLPDCNSTKIWWFEIDMNEASLRFDHLITNWCLESFCKKISKPSLLAIKDIFKQIDFLHLDGNFSEIGALLDVKTYLPKVKSKGYVLLSNLSLAIDHQYMKVKAFEELCDNCDIVAYADGGDTVLFRKK